MRPTYEPAMAGSGEHDGHPVSECWETHGEAAFFDSFAYYDRPSS